MASARVPNWVWLLLVVVHAVALGGALRTGSWNFPDSGRYLQAANNMRVYGELYARPWAALPQGQAVQEFTIRPAGYPLAVWGLGGAGRFPIGLLVVQNLLSLFNLGVVMKWWSGLARPESRHWPWILVAVFLFPAQFIYANAVMSEMLLQTVVVLLAAASLLFIRTQKARYFLGAGVAVVVALLIKPVFYPLAGVFLAVGALLAWCRKRAIPAVIGLMPLLVTLLYMGWNSQRTGYFHFSSIAEINLLHYNAAGVVKQTQGPEAEEQWVNTVLAEANAQPTFAARQRLIQARAGAVLRAHPVVYARQQAQGMAAFFLDPGRFDVSQFLRLASPGEDGLLTRARQGGLWRAVANLPLGLLALLGVVFLANAARLLFAVRGFLLLGNGGPAWRAGRWVAAGLLLYVALLTGPLGAARFLVPVWPLLLGLALVGQRGKGAFGLRTGQEPPPVGEGQRQS